MSEPTIMHVVGTEVSEPTVAAEASRTHPKVLDREPKLPARQVLGF